MPETYDGPVVFGNDGVHYLATEDGYDQSRPLRWVEGTTYRDATDGDELHNEANHETDLTLEPGTE